MQRDTWSGRNLWKVKYYEIMPEDVPGFIRLQEAY